MSIKVRFSDTQGNVTESEYQRKRDDENEKHATSIARVIHRNSTAACDAQRSAALSPIGVLQPTQTPPGPPASGVTAPAGGAWVPYVLSSTPPRPSSRKPRWARHLADLVTKPGEICRLISARSMGEMFSRGPDATDR